jgi:hypothetical protein
MRLPSILLTLALAAAVGGWAFRRRRAPRTRSGDDHPPP